ncbi:NUDIX hydrolase [Amnibacterium sp. CER49]|uniref:NUDIX hydrolase n=1 Tax=Amnibacterium sp. CER49 TaxID=3039161 RepID=UPI00244AF089|nr:NUDIX hydrolase [Amnibacterium sp. CER49]MDH2444730.1 NUDIX hydrolase [Amnibacterium sp. CER49]
MAGSGARPSGDGWVELPDGRRFWGRAGAAGLLAVSPAGAVLLQHRVEWSHFGGTWGLPGGARDLGETALEGALREAREETGIDAAALRPRFAVRLDLDVWSYTTVAADAPAELPVAVSDRESTGLEWVAADEVDARPLHPGFADAWPRLRALLPQRDALVVDVANVMGSRPDGWWRDRRGAAERLLAALAARTAAGFDEPAADGPLPVVVRWPRVVAVVEGEARGATAPEPVELVAAPGSGDDAIVDVTLDLLGQGYRTRVVTADRGLRERVEAAGAAGERPGDLLGRLSPDQLG